MTSVVLDASTAPHRTDASPPSAHAKAHDDAARLLATKIESGAIADGLTVRDIYRAGWGGLTPARRVRDGLAKLEELGWLRVVVRPTDGRSSEIVQLHPESTGGAQ